MIINKYTIAISALMISTAANAGFYVGPQIGGSFNTGSYKSFDVNNQINIHSAKGGAGAAFFGGLNFGYGHVTDSSIYLGIDGALLAHSLNNEVRRSSDILGNAQPVARLKNNFLYNVAFQIGYQMHSKVVPFISLGISGGEYKLSIANRSGVSSRGLLPGVKKTIEKNVNGFTPGLGVKFNICEKLTASIKYDFMFGAKLSKNFTDSVPNTWAYTQRVRQHGVSLAVVYNI